MKKAAKKPTRAKYSAKSYGLRWQKAICGICPSGCWVEVALKNGKLVDIRQDDSHTLGAICLRGEKAAEIVYSKHRLKYPMKRTGPKGTYEFTRISWDEAYDTIVENLNKIKKSSGPEAVAIYTGRGAQEQSLCDIFQPKDVYISSASNVLFPFGSPNTMGVGALCYVSLHMIAPHVTMGRMQPNMFSDIENAEMVVVWGTNPATDSPPVDMHRLEDAARRGADIIVIDPRHTETAIRIDAQWVPIRPGTDGALALSIIEVMIDEELYDEDFVENWCYGFKELQRYTQHFTPEIVEKITGVAADTIRDLARRICKASGTSLLMYTGLEYSNTGVQSARAIFTLFALANQLDVPGGIGLTMLGSEFLINRSCNQGNPDIRRGIGYDRFPIYSKYRGEAHAISLVDSVLKGEPYSIRSLIIHGSSLLTSWPQVAIWKKILSKLDFMVCIDRQLTADAAYADIILPATTMFENESYMVYGPIFRHRQKIIEPLEEARNDYLIMAELAERLGYGHIFPQTEEDLVRFALKGSSYTLEDVKSAGGWVNIPIRMLEYKKWQKGTLRKDGKSGFDTPTGKFEVWSTIFEEFGYEPLPKYTEPSEGPLDNPGVAGEFPLVFNSGARPQTDFRSQHHGIKSLVRDNPEPIIELNIEDARQRNIQNGDLVEVRTPRSRVPFRARVSSDIVKGAVECMMGGGTPVGTKAWQQWNVNELTDINNYDTISGFPIFKALLCEVVKIKQGTNKSKNSLGHIATCKYDIPRISKGNTNQHIYLDNNATTKMAEEVKEAILPYLEEAYGNPSSIHSSGRFCRDAVDRARRQLANLINTQPRRIIFTGGGSEANNLAIKGIAFSPLRKGNHIITTTIEHPSILNVSKSLEKLGYRITYLDVDSNGWLSPRQLQSALTDDTILVSIMTANNEVGTILPIKELCAVTHSRGVLFHTDAVQAIGKIEIDVQELDVDMLSIAGHKFHAPKGIGALFIRKGLNIKPIINGGSQEMGLRAGTENVPGIVGIGKASELAPYAIHRNENISALRDKLEKGVRNLIPNAILNGHQEQRLPNTLNLTLPGLRGESLVIALDQHGISLSSASACKSGSTEPSHVLITMGVNQEAAHCSVRFSLSRYTTEKDIEETVSALRHVLKEKDMVRLIPCK
jgi:cysteine desulfurase NifS